VGLTLKDYDKVKDVDWASLNPLLSGIELFTHKEKEFAEGTSPFPIYTKAHPDGACPFLIDNLCFIHGTLGESEKPTVCQLFPYTFVGTPRGVFAGVSHSSMASVRNIGRPLTEQRDMLDQMLALNKDLQVELRKDAGNTTSAPAAPQLNLAPGLPITWDEYFIVEERLILLTKQEPYENACLMWLAACEILAEASRLKSNQIELQALREFTPDLSVWQDRAPSSFESLLLTLMCFRWLTWPILKKRRSQSNQKPASRLDIFGYVVSALLSKKMELPNCGKVSLDKLFTQSFAPLSKEINHFMRQYLFLKLFGKTYFGSSLAGLSVIAGFNHLVAVVLISLLYAKACADKRGTEIVIEDLYESILLLDKQLTLVSQSTAQNVLLYDQGFASPRIFNRLLAQVGRSFAD